MRRSNKNGLTQEEIEEIRDAFNLFDIDNKGTIDPADLRTAMQTLGFETKNPTVYSIIVDLERKSGGPIDFEQFLNGITNKLGDRNSKEGIRKIFNLFDDDRTGTISFKNLKRVSQEIGENLTDEELQEILERANSNGDGEITFEDFYAIMTRKAFS